MDMSLYRDLFVAEARSHLSTFSELIVHLEESPDDTPAINELFRHAHSLKGMAATMGYEQIVAIAHLMEDQLGLIRTGESRLQPALADLLLEGSDTLTRLVSKIENGIEPLEDTYGLTERLAAFDPSAQTSPNSATNSSNVTGISPRICMEDSSAPERRHSDAFNSIRIKTETLDHLVNITGELITNHYRLAETARLAGAEECKEPLRQLKLLVRFLRDEVFKARMLPFAVISERFPRLVRDLARKQGKEVRFQLEGKEIELDRGILEEIAEPIVHILRNAVDHGLESADERVMAGKPFGGTIALTVSRDKDHVEIIITDDGRGMNPELMKKKGIEKGIISPEQAAAMTPQEAFQLICTAGFSTATAVSDISGRGVGMDAVREAVHALAGALTIRSTIDQGSSFIMRLPMTVSIIHAMIARCGSFEIAFPLTVVAHTAEVNRSEIHKETGRLTVVFDDLPMAVCNMRSVLNLQETDGNDESLQPMLICDVGGTQVAFTVDSIAGQQEIFVRPLRSPLSHLRGVNGATIAGDGRVLFVADVTALA